MKINMNEFHECLSGIAKGDPATKRKSIGDLAKYSGAEWERAPDAITAAVNALTGALERPRSTNSDPAARMEAVKALGNIGTQSPGVVPAVLRVLQQDPDEEVRAEAARALGKIGEGAVAASRALTSVLKTTAIGEGLRGEAARALARVDPTAPGTAVTLRTAAKDRSAYVSICAAEALWRVSPDAEQVVPALASRLRDPEVRDVAAQALYRIGPKAKGAVPALLTAAKDKDRLFRESVLMALKKIDPEAAARVGG
jgi:HEAT repeat protein